MSVWWRAVVATALLIGFYLLALAMVGGLAVVTAWSLANLDNGGAAVSLAAVTGSLLVLTVLVSVRAMRPRRPPPALELTYEQAPDLWDLVRAVAGRVATRAPRHVRLTATANAWVFEDARFWGLRPGRRYLDIGAPLLMALSTGQLTAVIAHELGHYSHQDTRLGEVVYRGREIITDVLEGLGWAPLRAVLRGYLGLYWSISAAVLRRQEWAADQTAAAVTDPATMADALHELTVAGAAWRSYLDDRVALHRCRDCAPENICGDFHAFLLALVPNPAGTFAALPGEPDRWDTHPPLAERVAVLERMASTHPPDQSPPAAGLVPGLRAYGPRLDAISFPLHGRTPLPFPDYAVRVAESRATEQAQLLYRAARRSDLVEVLDLLAAGKAERLAAEITRAQAPYADPAATAHLLAQHLEAALSTAVVRGGLARWRYSWATGVRLEDRQGRPFRFIDDLDLAGLAATLCTGSTKYLAALRARLAALDTEQAGSSPADTPAHLELYGAAANITANGRPCDVLILATGLTLLPGDRQDSPSRRLDEYASLVESTHTPPEYGWTVSYTDVRAALLLHPTRANLRLILRDGTSLLIEETRDTAYLPTRHEDPRELLRRITETIPGDAPRDTVENRPPRPATITLGATEAEVVRRSRQKMITGGIFLIPGLLFLAAAGLTRTPPTALYSAAACGIAPGTMLLLWGRMERTRGRGRGTGFIVCGALLAAGFVVLAVITRTWLPWFCAAYGALLASLGVARRNGRWPPRDGNALKVAAGAPVALALGVAAQELAAGRPPWPALGFLIPAAMAYLLALFLAYARSGDKAAMYGIMGFFGLAVPPLAIAFSIMSIRQARKIGARPTLGIAGIGTTVLLCAALVLAALMHAGSG